jgi:hypothetical protein
MSSAADEGSAAAMASSVDLVIVISAVPMAAFASAAAVFSRWSTSAAAVKYEPRSSRALKDRIDDVEVLGLELVPLGLGVVSLVHEATARAASTIAATTLRTTHLLPL